MAVSVQYWKLYVGDSTKLSRKSENAVASNRVEIRVPRRIAASNNMTLHLVQGGLAWAGCGPAQSLLAVGNSPPI